jgi:hypothetical protein
VGPLRPDRAMTRRGGTDITFGLRGRIIGTAVLAFGVLSAWVVLAPTLVAVPVILIPGTAIAIKILWELWRAVPVDVERATEIQHPRLSDLVAAGDLEEGPSTLRRWLTAVAALVFAGIVVAYLTGDEERRFIILGSVVIASSVLALRWALGRDD